MLNIPLFPCSEALMPFVPRNPGPASPWGRHHRRFGGLSKTRSKLIMTTLGTKACDLRRLQASFTTRCDRVYSCGLIYLIRPLRAGFGPERRTSFWSGWFWFWGECLYNELNIHRRKQF